jgi:DNA-binding MarR family transcriptional regulator
MTDVNGSNSRGAEGPKQVPETGTGSVPYENVRKFEEVRGKSRTPAASDLLSLAKRIITARQKRSQYLATKLLGEPAYDMLLSLFVASLEQRPMSVSELVRASGVPSTTALRWIGVLQDHGMTRRRNHPLDARVTYVEFEQSGMDRMQALLEVAFRNLQE